ncbi:MAG: arginine--tRNA ligase [Endomicrobiia bacterium]
MKEKLKKVFDEILKLLDFETIDFEIKQPPFHINFEFATNLPILLSSKYRLSSQEVFGKIKQEIEKNFKDIFSKIDFSLPGFLNFDLNKNFYFEEIKIILTEKENYPVLDIYKNEKVLFEFVSANPTGPLHIGHGRCAVLGDVLGNIFKKLGCIVEKEYYINDRGKQIDILVGSIIETIIENNLIEVEAKVHEWSKKVLCESRYKGDYIKEFAYKIVKFFNKITLENLEDVKSKIISLMMIDIKKTLEKAKVYFDNFVSENSLYRNDISSKVKKILEEYIEQKDNALWMKSRQFGDDKDRVIIKSDGQPTYFFSDILYHYQKIIRGYSWLVNIWGADHHGYVERLKSAVEVISQKLNKNVKLDIILYQLVSLIKQNQRISMSTREGKFISLDEVLNDVGVDVCRFFLLTKSPDTHLDFDIELAKEHSLNNPVYYIQYAHTRCVGILNEAQKILNNFSIEEKFEEFKKYIFSLNSDSHEFKLIKTLCIYPDVLMDSAKDFSPHYLCNYLIDLSRVFHKFYETSRVVEKNNIHFGRLLLVLATKIILYNSLSILNIEAPQKM